MSQTGTKMTLETVWFERKKLWNPILSHTTADFAFNFYGNHPCGGFKVFKAHERCRIPASKKERNMMLPNGLDNPDKNWKTKH